MVLKGDVQGSVEALVGALKEIPQNKITLDIIHSAVGPITESDVLLGERLECGDHWIQRQGREQRLHRRRERAFRSSSTASSTN